MKNKFKLLLIAVLIATTSCVAPAQMQQVQRKQKILDSRIAALEQQKIRAVVNYRNELRELKKLVSKKLTLFQKNHLFYLNELEQIKSDSEVLTNDQEFSKKRIIILERKLKSLRQQIGRQNQELEKFQTFFNQSDNQIKQRQGSNPANNLFRKGLKYFNSRNFKQAEKIFKQLKKYRKSSLIDDATFYIGNIQFLQGRYDNAVLHFFDLLEQYPKSNKLNQTRWLLGISLERTGDKNGAIEMYNHLAKLPANSPLRVKAELRLDELKPLTAK